MNLRTLKDRFVAIPWVYDTLRPLVAGGIDLQALAAFCGLSKEDRVFDLGCGTARLIRFISCSRYLGVDLDSNALERASQYASHSVRFVEGDNWDEAYALLKPTVVLMIGVIHHLSDDAFHSLITRLRQNEHAVPRIVTIDVSFFPGHPINNLLSKMDRGRHVRRPHEYEKLFAGNCLRISRSEVLSTRLRYVHYAGYHLRLTTAA